MAFLAEVAAPLLERVVGSIAGRALASSATKTAAGDIAKSAGRQLAVKGVTSGLNAASNHLANQTVDQPGYGNLSQAQFGSNLGAAPPSQ